MSQHELTSLDICGLSVSCAKGGADRPGQARLVLEDVSLQIQAGSLWGLIGPSGCGKSTLLAVASGRLQAPLQRVCGHSILRRDGAGIDVYSPAASVRAEARQRIGFVYQDPRASLNDRRRLLDIVADPLYVCGPAGRSAERIRPAWADVGRRVSDMLASRFHHRGTAPLPERLAQATQMLEDVGLVDLRYHTVQKLSGGQRQRVAIARALVTKPDIIFLDEPTSALDLSTQAQVVDLLLSLRVRYRCTYLFASHDLALIRQIADQIVVMERGRIVEQGSAERVLSEPCSSTMSSMSSACQSSPGGAPSPH